MKFSGHKSELFSVVNIVFCHVAGNGDENTEGEVWEPIVLLHLYLSYFLTFCHHFRIFIFLGMFVCSSIDDVAGVCI